MVTKMLMLPDLIHFQSFASTGYRLARLFAHIKCLHLLVVTLYIMMRQQAISSANSLSLTLVTLISLNTSL